MNEGETRLSRTELTKLILVQVKGFRFLHEDPQLITGFMIKEKKGIHDYR